ncbi:hypothetical protein LG293_09675 [Citricoccus nitrophenolicus]
MVNEARENRVSQPMPAAANPTVTIYQNPDHVSGILQQVFRSPLAREGTVEGAGGQETSTTLSAEGGVEGNANLGWLGSKFGVASKLAAAANNASTSTSAETRTSVWEYTQAFYLHIVRESLRDGGSLRSIASLADAQALKVGDLVEYTSEFAPDQMAVFLDVLTPELVSSIVRYQVKKRALEGFDDWGNFEARQAYFEKTAARIETETELAEAVTRAVRTDFRSDDTREFFGQLGEGDNQVTAITMCDSNYFTVEDTDRILDGTFTVLGKVAAAVEEDRPTLERNKLLSSVPAESVDALVGTMMGEVEGAIDKAKMNGEVAFDLNLSARIDGASFKVIPIAIYV